MADNAERIAEIREILRSGVSSFTNDGTQVTHDFESLRKELRELVEDDDEESGQRPPSYNFDLSGF